MTAAWLCQIAVVVQQLSSLALTSATPLSSPGTPDISPRHSPAHDLRALGEPNSQADLHQGPAIRNSYWYDWGWHGAYPRVQYESFGALSPKPNLVTSSNKCDDGFIFVEPRGIYVDTPGPVMLDNEGNLVWMETRWGQAMDLKVQSYKGKDYITFWHGSDNGTFGEGYYLMLDETYEVARKITPVGALKGDLHEFRITDSGSALMTVYHKVQADMSGYGIDHGWIYDSMFQEIDLDSGELIFEWRASEHFDIADSLFPLNGHGKSADKAFDFFHINSIDKNEDGDYLISSRYYCAVFCLSHETGDVLWTLGGRDNDFEDRSGGAATDMCWNHHAAWHGNDTITVFDNASNGKQTSNRYSRGLMVQLDQEAMSATLIHSYVAPLQLLAPSQGSVQVLPNGNVLVGWGHTPAYTEYTMDGEVLCDTHLGPVRLANFAWEKNYRTFKYRWVGQPSTPPQIAVRPAQDSVYVSWNGATEVKSWRLQSASHSDATDFVEHGEPVRKTTFETKFSIPRDAGHYIRVAALDGDSKVLGYTQAVSKDQETDNPLTYAPSRSTPPEPIVIFALSLAGTILLCLAVYFFRSTLRRGLSGLMRRGAASFEYHPLPTKA